MTIRRSQSFFRKVTNCESVRSTFATSFLYCILDASISSIAYLALLALLSRQIDRAHSPAALTRLSPWTFLSQAIVDAIAFAGHITFAILANGRPSMSLVAPAFLACVLFALEAVSNASWVWFSVNAHLTSNMRFSLSKSRPQRMQQLNKFDLLPLLPLLPLRQLLTPFNPNFPCQLRPLLVPLDPPSLSSSFVIFGRTHKPVFVRVHLSPPAPPDGQSIHVRTRARNVLVPHIHYPCDRHALPRTLLRFQHVFHVLVPTNHSLSQAGTTQRINYRIPHRNIYLQTLFCTL